MFSIGPPMHAPSAIVASPRRATDKFAIRSGNELPSAYTVSPIIAGDTDIISPSAVSVSNN